MAVKHGLSHTRIKRIYYNMRSRCYNPNTPKFKNHGGRGIKVCDEWMGEYGLVNFYNWAMQNGYDESLTIDRINNDGDYSPDNCRWVNYSEQNRNTRRNHEVTINGVTKLMTDWCNEYGIDVATFKQRLDKGWTGNDLISHQKTYPGCSSGFKGVHYRSDSGKWRATINKDGTKYNLGTYKNLEDAVKARLDGELKYYGEYISDIFDVENKLVTLYANKEE